MEPLVRHREIHPTRAVGVVQVKNSTVRFSIFPFSIFQSIFLFPYRIYISNIHVPYIFWCRCVQNHDHYTLLNLVNAVKYHISVRGGSIEQIWLFFLHSLSWRLFFCIFSHGTFVSLLPLWQDYITFHATEKVNKSLDSIIHTEEWKALEE